jgi:DNA-binding transcriptional MerR regulator
MSSIAALKIESDQIAASAAEDDENQEFLISDLAREFGVTLRALRFYEDRGLLSPKRIGTMRIYSAKDRARLSVILKGKQLGFTLAEIQEMLAPHERGGQACVDLKLSLEKVDEQIAHLEAQRVEIDAAIEELRATRAELAG